MAAGKHHAGRDAREKARDARAARRAGAAVSAATDATWFVLMPTPRADGSTPAPRGDVPYHTDGGFGLPVVFTTAGGARDFARSRFTVDQATGDRMPIREAYDVTPILRGELLAARDGAPFLLDGRPVKGGGGEDDD